jgi:hypothetical protein
MGFIRKGEPSGHVMGLKPFLLLFRQENVSFCFFPPSVHDQFLGPWWN